MEQYFGYQGITSLLGLNLDPEVKKLWLHKNQIRRIEGLESLTNLQKILLENNQISEIEVYEYKSYLLTRNKRIQWKVVQPIFLEYCLALAPLDLPVLIQIEIFNYNSYDNHRKKKWKIGKYVKDIWLSKKN